ncbi:SDR family NAD(P)-dependent oxidoreductase [Salinicoccus roseus]|uniref:SDR family NAD(P)-dependent oxidoreductase n=1 Tax=Salinicoccus roseus TaxID=45670 RepID=UPI002301096F|nr:SDR family oxidoreductase [Salinicoccus roseus]
MGRLDGKVAVITGAGSGQGAMEAELFAREGAKIVATDMNDEQLGGLLERLGEQYPDAVIGLRHDVTKEADWQHIVEEAVGTFGKVDILINNAGITGITEFTLNKLTIEEWDKVMNVNALGNFLGMKHVIPEMKRNGQGSIVNISSLTGISGLGGLTAYSASKGAIRTMTKGAARDFGGDHIRVNSIHPGYIETPSTEYLTSNADIRDALIAAVPLKYLGESEDVAYAALFLASDEAKFITGEELIIDGGQTIKE